MIAGLEKLVDEVLPRVIELRHQIHTNPELSGKEFETSALVRETLADTSIQLLPPFLETDVVGMLEGTGEGANVALRADMDALPLTEDTGVLYQSKNDGVMHACGHDGHTATLLGAALVLNELRDSFPGSVRFVFQPGEEGLMLGKDLVAAGALKDPEPEMVLALHCWPNEPLGSISCAAGPTYAGAYMFSLVIKGRGGHGAHPEFTIDPILTSARVINALQAISSRMVAALQPVVVSICHIDGGMNSNVIPNEVKMQGTARFHDQAVGDKLPAMIEQITSGICQSMGASYEINYGSDYIPLVNDAGVVEFGKKIAIDYLGESAWKHQADAVMGSEDFAYYLVDNPGAQFRLGMGESPVFLHNPKFNFNDEALKNGILFLVASTIEKLKKG